MTYSMMLWRSREVLESDSSPPFRQSAPGSWGVLGSRVLALESDLALCPAALGTATPPSPASGVSVRSVPCLWSPRKGQRGRMGARAARGFPVSALAGAKVCLPHARGVEGSGRGPWDWAQMTVARGTGPAHCQLPGRSSHPAVPGRSAVTR